MRTETGTGFFVTDEREDAATVGHGQQLGMSSGRVKGVSGGALARAQLCATT